MKVFVTIGSQEPFARLLQLVDDLAPEFPGLSFTAQTTAGKPFAARHIETLNFIPPAEFSRYLAGADLVICHAGIGTILNVLELEKPLVVFPRQSRFHETRDDHQVATAHAFRRQGYLYVAENKEEMRAHLLSFESGVLKPCPRIRDGASPELIDSLASFIG
jgi:UDP-N-acetylglucosamine transferase subunit ALG13